MKNIIIVVIIIAIAAGLYTISQKNQGADTQLVDTTMETQTEVVEMENDTQTAEALLVTDGEYSVDTDASSVAWVGRTPVKKHDGTLAIKSGSLNVVNGELTGTVVFDMNTIVSDSGDGLDSHLKSADFFEVETYPEATLDITNYNAGVASGTLTLRGVTNSITIPATVNQQVDGSLLVNAQSTFNRVNWGVEYNSGTLLSELGDKAINDDIEFNVQLVAQAATEAQAL